jgi:hypothetical protein
MIDVIKRSKFFYVLLSLYIAIYAWWMYITLSGSTGNYLFNWSYGLIAVSSAVYGYKTSKKWGGFKSSLGRLIMFLSIGLLAQGLGLQVWTYYNMIAKTEVPYPSFADIGYFGLVPAYAYASFQLAKVCAAKVALKSIGNKAIAVIIPIAALLAAFLLFVKDVGFDTGNPIKLFFDLAYPIGEIIPFTVAIVTLILSAKGLMGGKMHSRIWWLVFAFGLQFATEYLFLYQSGVGSYVNGGIVDLMYATSYFVMGISLISLSRVE